LLVVAVLSGFAALYVASDLLVPVAFAMLLYVLLSPAVQRFKRLGIPVPLAAGVLVSLILAVAVLLIASLATPAEEWLDDAPRTIRDLRTRFLLDEGRLADIQQLAKDVDELATTKPATAAQPVVVEGPGTLENVLGGLPGLIVSAGIVIFLTFFLLASDDSLLRSVTRCGRDWGERRRIVKIARTIQADLSGYLATVTVINIALGAAVVVALHLLEVPNPLLWGATATLLNFVPYLGATAMMLVLTLVGLTTFDDLNRALLVPATFLVLTILEGQLFTPAVLGRRMAVGALVVFLSVAVWGWLWGMAGALMAVPLTMCFKVFCDHIPGLAPASDFLQRRTYGRAARERCGAPQRESWAPRAGDHRN
jgi:predicted PurR-regulated permease PerM